MKKTALFLILIITALSICACGKNKASYDVQKGNVKNTGTVNESNTAKYELTDILNNKIPFTDESGKSVYLKNYRSEKYPDLQITPEKYAIIDLDNDGTNELVLYVSPKFGLYLVFHEYNGVIYSFEFTERAMIDLKQNGSFIQSSGAVINSYVTLKFSKDKYTIKKLKSSENFNNAPNAEWTQITDEDKTLYNRFLSGKAEASDKQGGKLKISDLSDNNSTEYAFYDINGDGKDELFVRSNLLYIFWIKDNEVALWHEDLNYVKILSDNTLLSSREGTAPEHTDYIYKILGYGGNELYKAEFSEYRSDTSHKYFANGAEISENVYKSLFNKILNSETAAVNWLKK